VAPANYVGVLVEAAGYVGPGEYVPRVTRLEAPFLSFLNVRARFGGGPNPAIAKTQAPPAVFPGRLSGGTLDACLANTSDFLAVACVEGSEETFSGKAVLVSYTRVVPEVIRAEVEADASRVLVLPEFNDGGWAVEGDDRPLTTLMANGAFLGIRIPAGRTRITCRYRPPGFRTGLAISAGSLLLVIVIAVSRSRGIPMRSPTRRGARSSSRSSAAEAAPRERGDTDRRAPRRDDGASASAGPP
jgi:hypothetical protein